MTARDPADESARPHPGRADSVARLARQLGFLHDEGKAPEAFASTARTEHGHDERPLGRARKVSVSMPEELTVAVQRRVGRGEFSQYVTEAVTRQLELDLLGDLAALLAEEHGAVPEEFLAEAGAAWPDVE
ncbi:hypothetical protein GCM10022243_16410 [Saccharothrix violaceirubra]|uniref:Arc/MetJ-type ribon-helix-helix transcriptional regulator n=1 Tax=Saccharothrix violaceirubra TaxID=413306 RepID=A0A7W7WXP9_9PSEU|nr:hypothetical protein [Saccharothrix violaceirubra]MBB4967669.1 Arc/MetJ-type ribon-helix-helix transcriptional regulator [Saccharothrix violaceirubra]